MRGYKGGQVTKPIIVVKMSCELLIYIIQVKGFLIKSFTFLALLDIKALVTYHYLQCCF